MYTMQKILLLLAPILFFVFTSCGKIEEPQFRSIGDFGVKKLGLKETVVGLSVTYYNPNKFGVTVKEAAIDVYIDSTYLGKFVQPQSVAVQNKADFVIPMEGTIGLDKALQFNIPALIGKEVFIQAKGAVKVGKAGVFITKDINYSGRHVLDKNLIKNPAGAGLN